MHIKKTILVGFVLTCWIFACKKDSAVVKSENNGPTPYSFINPAGFPEMTVSADNPLTVEGVALGRKLFYDPILSANHTLACAGCHRQNFAFADSNLAFSIGIMGTPGVRNAPALFNLAWQKKFFWDGGVPSLEDQVIAPISNPLEMHDTLSRVIAKLQNHTPYPGLFKLAFGTDSITTKLLMKAIAQFERTIVSANSRYDQWKQGKVQLTQPEMSGMQLYLSANGGCNHCHVLGGTFTDFEFRNNGLDSTFKDEGRSRITLNPNDMGKFKTPTLRNIALTSPYMHDGRFKTLKEVIEFYNSNFHVSNTVDPNIASQTKGRMSALEIDNLIAFLNTLTDPDLLTDQKFSKTD